MYACILPIFFAMQLLIIGRKAQLDPAVKKSRSFLLPERSVCLIDVNVSFVSVRPSGMDNTFGCVICEREKHAFMHIARLG
jgi:hypothetical protein